MTDASARHDRFKGYFCAAFALLIGVGGVLVMVGALPTSEPQEWGWVRVAGFAALVGAAAASSLRYLVFSGTRSVQATWVASILGLAYLTCSAVGWLF